MPEGDRGFPHLPPPPKMIIPLQGHLSGVPLPEGGPIFPP